MLLLLRQVVRDGKPIPVQVPRTRRVWGWTVLLAAFVGCNGGSEPSVPASITISPPSVTFTALGQTQQISASVSDQNGNPLPDAGASWSSSNSAVVTVSPTGLVTALGTGSTAITATAGAATATVQVTVVQTPTELLKISGDGQTATVGQILVTPFIVQVNDALGHPVPGATVSFTVLSPGAGSVGTANATTGSDGRASTTFTAGGSVGARQVSASLASTTITVSFTVTITSVFNVTIRFLSPATPSQRQAFADAQSRWETLVTGDVENVPVSGVDAGTCGPNSPAVNETIDDLLIFVTVEPIDGPGGTLGTGGPCFIRTTNNLTVIGGMQFDTADLEDVEAEGLLSAVILHEMGHVLGFGTIWDLSGLLVDASLLGGMDPHFTGAQAIAAFNNVGGAAYSAGSKVPVEDNDEPGQADAHWRESVLRNELMTTFADQQNVLSMVTVASLADLGYIVNSAGADPFVLAPSLRARGSGPRLQLGNDIFRVPVKGVGPDGRVVGVVRQ